MGSAAEAPTLPDAHPVRGLRASGADRDEVVAKLADEYAAGRLSHETFLFRMNAVLEARHQSDLPRLLADLPGTPGQAAPGQAASGAAPGQAAPGLAPLPGQSLPGQSLPLPGQSLPGQSLPWPGGQAPDARPAGGRGLAGRLRAAISRRQGSGAAFSGEPASRTPSPRRGPARRLTGAMPRAGGAGDAGDGTRRPAPLRFPRGLATQFSIGRNEGCDLAIADMTVSRLHARLERTPDGWTLTDLASANGTRVNGWLVRGNVPVRAGDLVSFGKAEYWLSAADEGV